MKILSKATRVICIALLFLKAGLCFPQSSIPQINEKTKKLAAKFLTKEKIPGMSISISVSDSLVFSSGFGFSDIETHKLVSPSETKFRIASITKTITAATIARLSELSQIDFKKSVHNYLDSLPKKQFDFTVDEVGAHLSGIKRLASTEKYTCDNVYGRDDFYKVFKSDALLFEPATNFEYSNYGYKLLGLIVEKTTGNAITENHKRYVIDIIGLKNTLPEIKIKDTLSAKFYTQDRGKLIAAPCLDCTFKYAQGCYLSTSEDLVKLGNAYLHPGRILKKETLVDLIKSRKLKNGTKTNYGFGFASGKDVYGNQFYGHNGGYEGSRSSLRIYPNSKLVISILINRDIEDIDALVAEIARNYIAELR